MSFYVDSFIAILHCISDELIQVDSSTQIGELYCEEFDDVDFELALFCFEATHRMAFSDELPKIAAENGYEDLTIEEFMERFLDQTEQTDPLFVTRRFLDFQDILTRALVDDDPSSPPPPIED